MGEVSRRRADTRGSQSPAGRKMDGVGGVKHRGGGAELFFDITAILQKEIHESRMEVFVDEVGLRGVNCEAVLDDGDVVEKDTTESINRLEFGWRRLRLDFIREK